MVLFSVAAFYMIQDVVQVTSNWPNGWRNGMQPHPHVGHTVPCNSMKILTVYMGF